MLAHINVRDLIFIDIETVPCFSSFEEVPPSLQELWAAKHSTLRVEGESPEDGYLKRAGVFAEFAKVICISLGFLRQENETGKLQLRLKTIKGDNEPELLETFVALLQKGFNTDRYHFCGHNIREFDIPFLCRRLLINRISFPDILDISGKRPWEMFDVDTLQLWKFGDYKHYTSLKLLTEVLGIPSPKSDMDGKDVCRVYWQEKDLNRIADYCQRDVVTVARLLLRFKGESFTLEDDDVVVVS